MLRLWDKYGLKLPRERIRQWKIVNNGMTSERAVCEQCGASISRSMYRYKHSLPLACPKCMTPLYGFFTV